jgi:hypothetical protein
VWLFGYDERNQPLTEALIFEDVMQDYTRRTVGTPNGSRLEGPCHMNHNHMNQSCIT